MTEERKASDVLASIEQKTDLILGYVKTLDFNYKLILNSLRDSKSKDLVVLPVEPRAEAFVNNKENIVSKLSEQISTKNIESSIPTGDLKKISLQQRILYFDDKPVVLANVEIWNLDSSILLKKTRTNNVGKWNAILEPGKYKIMIRKTGTADKPPVERAFEVMVNQNSPTMELEVSKS